MQINLVKSHKFLEMIIDQELSFKEYVVTILAKGIK